jgi:dolichol-phosphate mannosyltransferase
MDADLQHAPELVPELLKVLETHDIAVASRYCKGGSIEGWSWDRRLVSWIATLMALPLAPKVKDRGGGFFALRKSALPPLHKLKGTGFKVLLEILVKAGKCEVREVPERFVLRTKGTSKFNIKQVREYLKHLASLYIYKYRRFLKFCLVGVWGSVVNLGLLLLLTEVAGLHYVASAVIGVETAIITQFILNDQWTFRDRRDMACGTLVRARKYFLTCTGGVTIYFLILIPLTEFAGVYYAVSAVIGIFVGFLWNYAGSTLWAWRAQRPHTK